MEVEVETLRSTAMLLAVQAVVFAALAMSWWRIVRWPGGRARSWRQVLLRGGLAFVASALLWGVFVSERPTAPSLAFGLLIVLSIAATVFSLRRPGKSRFGVGANWMALCLAVIVIAALAVPATLDDLDRAGSLDASRRVMEQVTSATDGENILIGGVTLSDIRPELANCFRNTQGERTLFGRVQVLSAFAIPYKNLEIYCYRA